ncbi:TatD family hydrolase [Vibrio porteresiae]|uniref:TatD family hydrolase n=1 Tax=Vibrio porteresiae DSM 19223 TaxID=1123496 RepID=A0ABZ0QDY9_9VIBR|nr:TatD family hydrolase [Vibrio porteresiae]WPC74668.1 TatD family hydrolase [Vibrio porteresiae DSM 19223]
MLFDTHCHFDFAPFIPIERSLAKAQEAGVSKILIPGTEPRGWDRLSQLTQSHSQRLWGAYGLHPYFLHEKSSSAILALDKALAERNANIVALGECGLDGVVDVPAALQEAVLMAQISLATQHKLPLILHCRKQHQRLLKLLKTARFEFGGVLHGFSGSVEQVKPFIDLGFKVGIGGVITYPRANKTRQSVAKLPLSSLVLETDAPDMPLNGYQGEPNHPAHLPQVLTCLAELREENPTELVERLWQNSHEVFHLD